MPSWEQSPFHALTGEQAVGNMFTAQKSMNKPVKTTVRKK